MYNKKDFSYLLNENILSEKTLKNHLALYEGYVTKTNELLEKIKTLDKNSPECAELKRRLGWEWNGMRLHELYFENLGAGQEIDKTSKLHQAASESFGSFEAFLEDFVATGKMRGIGWVVTYQDEAGVLMNFWIGEHDEGHPSGLRPILVMDVFEHAYFLDFEKDRAAYIQKFMNNINWKIIEGRVK